MREKRRGSGGFRNRPLLGAWRQGSYQTGSQPEALTGPPTISRQVLRLWLASACHFSEHHLYSCGGVAQISPDFVLVGLVDRDSPTRRTTDTPYLISFALPASFVLASLTVWRLPRRVSFIASSAAQRTFCLRCSRPAM